MNVQVAVLRRHLLPLKFDPLGQYRNAHQVQTRTRAFVILSHAEIEGYLEAWSKSIARQAEDLWNARSRISPPLGHLLGAHEGKKPLRSVSNAGSDGPAILR